MSSPGTSETQQPLRTFIASDYTATRSCQILASDSKTVLYSLDCPLTTSKTHPYSQTLHAGSSVKSPIFGASMLSWVTTTIKLAFGDPNSKTVQWEKMHKNSILSLNYNHYWFGIDLPAAVAGVEGNGSGSVRKEFEWKGTKGNGNEGTVGKVGNKIVRRSIKLLDKGTGEIVARFVSSGGEGERGCFEIWKDFGDSELWERVVILSSLALQEFWRKGTMLS